jgi:glycosyltransferase involved in cell wall biosynthesis
VVDPLQSPTLSIVIPVTKMAGRLQNLRNTLSTVDWNRCEVLLMHDVQDIYTSPELEELKSTYECSSLFLYEGSWGNPGSARNFGLEKSSGHWIVFWDSDDLGISTNVLRAIDDYKDADIVIGGFRVFDIDSGITRNHNSPAHILELAYNPGLWRVVFARKKIQELRFPEYLMGEDQVFLARCENLGLEHKFYNAMFYVYFKSIPNQLTSNPKALKEIEKAIKDIHNLLNEAVGRTDSFMLLMLIRQVITYLKVNSWSNLRPALGILGINFAKRPWRFTQALFRFFSLWLKSKISIQVVA